MTPSHRYALEVAINSVSCDVQLNDVPIVRNYGGDRLDVTIPVSDFVVPGENAISIRALIDRSEGGKSATQATARLLATPYRQSEWRTLAEVRTVAEVGAAGEATREPLGSLLGPVSPQSSVYDHEIMMLQNSRSIILQAVVPGWAWLGSPAIPETEDTLASLRRWYQGFHEALAAGRGEVSENLLAEKIGELSLAHGLPPASVAFEIGLGRALRDETLELSRVAWAETRMERAAEGRLVRLYHPRDGAIVSFTNPLRIFHTFDFWLRKDGAGWAVAR